MPSHRHPRGARTAGLVALAALGVLATTLLAPRQAAAYPQFQFSSGTARCAQCHYAPTGYGLISGWGRSESADTLSTFGGDGDFAHGLVPQPSWLALGGDIRLATAEQAVGGPNSPELLFFPMQAELYSRFAFGETGISAYVAIGARATDRDNSDNVATRHLPGAISREHYLMWKKSANGPYVRAGRYYAPYGLRLVEHIFYVRRFTGFGLYEETYNVTGGYLHDDWEVHVTAFTPPPKSFPDVVGSVGDRGSGGAAYGEMRFAPTGSISLAGALQARAWANADHTHFYQGGLVGKLWAEPAKLLVLGELDLQRRQASTGIGASQLVSYLGATFFPYKGVMAGVAYERFHEDLRVAASAHNGFDLQVNFFPWAHVELMAIGRYVVSGTSSASGDPGTLVLAQLHYYF